MAEAYVPVGARIGAREKQLLIVALLTAFFVFGLNQQIVGVAAPSLLADLGGFSLLAWVFTSYMLATIVVAPITAKLSDVHGRRPFMMLGCTVFVAGSLLCAAALTMPMLIGGRFVQGAGSGMMMATVAASLGDLFPPSERGKYMALFFGLTSVSQLVGPAFGGVITDTVGWRWCFVVTVPLAIGAFVATAAFFPRQERQSRARLDLLGVVLLTGAVTALLVAINWSREALGWSDPVTVALLSSTAILTVLFILQEQRHPDPVVPMRLLRDRNIGYGIIGVSVVTAVTPAVLTFLPTFAQVGLNETATGSGLITAPQAVGVVLGSVVAGQVMARTGRWRVLALLSYSVMLSGVLLISTAGTGDPAWQLSIFVALIGFASASLSTTLPAVILNAAPDTQLGAVTGIRVVGQQLVTVVLVAVLGVVLTATYQDSFDDRIAQAQVTAGVPASIIDAFHDPTLTLDDEKYAAVRTELGSLPGGAAFLESALGAQREAVASANRAIFGGVALLVLISTGLSFAMREVPLRRTFDNPANAPAAPTTPSAVPPEPAAARPVVEEQAASAQRPG